MKPCVPLGPPYPGNAFCSEIDLQTHGQNGNMATCLAKKHSLARLLRSRTASSGLAMRPAAASLAAQHSSHGIVGILASRILDMSRRVRQPFTQTQSSTASSRRQFDRCPRWSRLSQKTWRKSSRVVLGGIPTLAGLLAVWAYCRRSSNGAEKSSLRRATRRSVAKDGRLRAIHGGGRAVSVVWVYGGKRCSLPTQTAAVRGDSWWLREAIL
jgi:hypothetical protein